MHRLVGLVPIIALLSLVACGGPPKRPAAVTHHAPTSVWHVGPFMVREVTLPPAATANAFPNMGPYALSGGFTMAEVTSQSPYTVSRKDFATGTTTRFGAIPCAQQPFFAQTDGPGAALFCPAAVGASSNDLYLVDGHGPMRHVTLPVTIPVPADRVTVNVQEFDGYVEWWVTLNTPDPISAYGSGLISIASGQNEPIPSSIREGPAPTTGQTFGGNFIGPHGHLFNAMETAGDPVETLYEWSATSGRWTKLGDVSPGPYPYGGFTLASEGSQWWMVSLEKTTGAYVYKWSIVRTSVKPPVRHVWHVHGEVLGVGPGYYAYLDYGNPSVLHIVFPLEHRTLTFKNLTALSGPPYLLNQPAQWGTNYSTLSNTHVIYVGVSPRLEKVLLITP